MQVQTTASRAPLGGAKVVEVDPSRDLRWDKFVRTHEHGTFYHLSAWMQVLRQTYHYTPHCLAVEGDDGQFSGILPLLRTDSRILGRKFVSLPFSDVCGPIANSSAVLHQLVDAAVRLEQTYPTKYLQLRSALPSIKDVDPRLAADERFLEFELPLSDDPDEHWRTPSWTKIRNHVRKAEKDGVVVRRAEDEQGLRVFYQLHLATTKKHGMPAQSFGYFQNLWRIFRPECDTRLLIAWHGDRAVGASLFVGFGDCVSYVYNASDPRALDFRPNYLLLWEAIKWACHAGYRRFRFGKTSRENAGLITFKRNWGAEATPLYYYYYPKAFGLTSSQYGEGQGTYQLITRLWRSLPAPLTDRVGGILYGYLS